MYHYSAFISYNHNPRDIRITRMLQKKLEHYKVPKGVSASGKEGLDRIFLDNSELEVTGDLNDLILGALKNSDFLIVICSPESKKSIWVQREIDFFLQSHTSDQILTVITAGEPSEVLPDRVLYQEKYNEDTGETERIIREPLSCDYRMPASKANRRELPRLVAALIGCRYDDLVQRQRSYRMKRQIVLLAISAVFLISAISYLAWSNHQIRINYENSLREQSVNLASQSASALEQGDRIGAIRYALDALPTGDKPRPVVSDAVLALSNALDLYHTPEDEKWSSVKQYSYDSYPSDIVTFSTKDGDYLAIAGLDGRVVIWDANKRCEIMSEYTRKLHESGTQVKSIFVSDAGLTVLVTDHGLTAVDTSKEKEVYNLDLDSFKDAGPSDVRPEFFLQAMCHRGNDLWICGSSNFNYNICHIDLNSGKLIRSFPAAYLPEKLRISADGSRLAVLYSDIDVETHGGSTAGGVPVDVFDTSDGSLLYTNDSIYALDVSFEGNDRLIICGFSDSQGSVDPSANADHYYRTSGSNSLSFSISKKHTLSIACLDSSTGSQLWTIDKEDMYSGPPWLETNIEDGCFAGDLICSAGKKALVYDRDGNEVQAFDYSSDPVCYSNKGNELQAVLSDGSLAVCKDSYDDLTIYENTFAAPVQWAVYGSDIPDRKIYILTSSNKLNPDDSYILQYEFVGSDPDWESFEQSAGLSYDDCYSTRFDTLDHCLIEVSDVGRMNNPENTIARIVKRDIDDSGKVLLDTEIAAGENVEYTDYEYIGICKEARAAYFVSLYDEGRSNLISVDLDSGTSKKTVLNFSHGLSPEEKGGTFSYTKPYWLEGGCIYDGIIYCPALLRSENLKGSSGLKRELTVLVIDPATGEVNDRPLIDVDIPLLDESERSFCLNPACGRALLADSAKGLTCYDLDGKEISVTGPLDFFPSGLAITDDGYMFAVESSESGNVLHIFDPESGAETARSDLGYVDIRSIGLHSITFRLFSQTPDGSTLLLTTENDAFILDKDDWSLQSVIGNAFCAYEPDSAAFVLGNSALHQYGRVPYRTLDDMIKEGNRQLGED